MMKGKQEQHKRKFLNIVSAFQPNLMSDERRKQIHNQASNKQNLEFIYLQENKPLLLVFLGLERHFCNQDKAAQAIRMRSQQIQAGVCSSYFGWKRVDNTMEVSKRWQQTNNIQNLSGCTQCWWIQQNRYDSILTIISLWLVYDCREKLMAMKPELVFRGWIKKWTSSLEQYKRKYLEILVGLSSKTMMEKYGMKVAAELISEEIATGKIYNGEKIFASDGTDFICHLLSVGRVIIEKDFYMQRQEERLMK